jgi:hypothetical protein
MENIYNLVLDLKQKITQTEIVIPQNDENTQKFRMKITQNGENYKFEEGVTAELAVLKSDGNFVVIDADNQGDVFVATLSPQALTTTGLTKAELRFKKGSELLTSTQFTFVVREVVVSVHRVASTTVYKELETLVTKSEEITKKLDAAVKTFDNVEEIKKQLEEINTKILQAKAALEKNIETANLKSEDIKKVIAQADVALQSFDSRKSEIENLRDLVKNATELNVSLQNLLTQIQKAEEINQTLKTQTETSTSVKNDLVAATQTGENLKQVLSDEVTKANQIEPTLKATNQQAESLKTTLVENNQKAEKLNKSLESNTTKAEGLNTNLQQLISDGNVTKDSLVPIVEDGKVKIATLEDLLSRVGKTKSEVEEIIAQGNLDKYITTVSLENKLQAYATKDEVDQKIGSITKSSIGLGDLENFGIATQSEAETGTSSTKYMTPERTSQAIRKLSPAPDLSGYATKNDLESIDVTGQLGDYAKTADVNSKLSGKVDKVSGKDLSSNDYTTTEKNKLSGIESGANKYTHPNTHSADMITETSTKRFVSDSEKSAWNGKLSSVSGQDISRSKAKGYNTSSTWQSISSSRDLEDWIGDFDKRSRENRDNINKKVDAVSGKSLSSNDFTNSYKSKLDSLKPVTKQDIKSLGFPEHVVLTESAYNALSSTQKNATDIFYYIKA